MAEVNRIKKATVFDPVVQSLQEDDLGIVVPDGSSIQLLSAHLNLSITIAGTTLPESLFGFVTIDNVSFTAATPADIAAEKPIVAERNLVRDIGFTDWKLAADEDLVVDEKAYGSSLIVGLVADATYAGSQRLYALWDIEYTFVKSSLNVVSSIAARL